MLPKKFMAEILDLVEVMIVSFQECEYSVQQDTEDSYYKKLEAVTGVFMYIKLLCEPNPDKFLNRI